MGIEREFKFILDRSKAEKIKDIVLGVPKVSVLKMKQGYLSKGGRVRAIIPEVVDGMTVDHQEVFKFTYKHAMFHKPGLLEFEQDIPREDFDLAWHDATHIIDKVRYRYPTNALGQKWEIDFFYRNGKLYLVMAECELYNEKSTLPTGVPSDLLPFFQYAVKEGDKRFSNRKLSNVSRVNKLLKEIGNETKAKSSSVS